MKTVYFDQTQVDGCVSVFSSKAKVIPAGTAVNAMPVRDKQEASRRFSQALDIQFIFRDRIPQVDFFSVPYLEVIATDSAGGWIGSLGEDAPVVYIDPDGKCWQIAQNLPAFLSITPGWKKTMTPYEGLSIYPSKEAAMADLEFIDPMQMI